MEKLKDYKTKILGGDFENKFKVLNYLQLIKFQKVE